MKLSKLIFALGVVVSLSACMTPEQIAARQRQEAAAHEQQVAQIRAQLISSCEQYGYKRSTPQMNECVERAARELVQQQHVLEQENLAITVCASRMASSIGYIPALGVCRQNPNAMPPQQTYSAPQFNFPTQTQTHCLPIPGGGMHCNSY